jgi:pimeloyl-ACP methyl ester carboxylesterase
MCFDENNRSSSPESANALPVILIHGYNEPPSVWSQWQHRLNDDGIRFCTVSFSDDECGSALAHADELSQIVQEVKSWTTHNQVNIVGHSKGGLDAREYLADSGAGDVANLIMIGTPNGGDILANEIASNPGLNFDFINLSCRPALYDIEIGAADTVAPENENTKYYTIAGDWNPSLNCPLFGFENGLYNELNRLNQGPNDGIVPIWSVKTVPHSTFLGATHDCHTGLLSDAEYGLSRHILLGR